ncbi:MAG: hypothetical protein GY841_13380 [FCB group bacterium]|nr:hypothetical protein [FCB group bacterium]
MLVRLKLTLFTAILSMLLLGNKALAEPMVPDPGEPDTAFVESKIIPLGTTEFSLEVGIYNDEELQAFDIGLIWDSPDITCDSVSFFGGRADYINYNLSAIDNMAQQAHAGAVVVSEDLLQPGRGIVYTAYFSVEPGAAEQIITIDSSKYSVAGELVFTLESGYNIYPQFVPGVVPLIDCSFKIVIDSLIISPAEGSSSIAIPDEIPIIDFDDEVVIYGSVDNQYGSPIADQTIEIFDGVSYNYGLPEGGLYYATTNSQGDFSYTIESLPEELRIGQLSPYWFAVGDSAIPLILPFNGESTLLESIGDTLAIMLSEMDYLPDSAVISLGTLDNPSTLLFSSYPENPTDLESPDNDQFFEGYANIYSGPIDRNFLGPMADSWLDRGLRLSNERINSVADQLHTLSTASSVPAWQPLCLNGEEKWQSIDNDAIDRVNTDFNFDEVNWVSIGIGAVTCGVGSIASGGTLAWAVCAPLAITISNEILIKPAVPDFCDLIIQAEDPEKCRDIGEFSADAFAMVATVPFGKLPNNNVTMFNNYFNMSKDPLKQAYWTSQYFNHLAGRIELGDAFLDFTHITTQYWPEDIGGFKEAAGIRDLNLNTPDVGAIQNIPLQIIVTDRQGAQHQISHSYDDPDNPTSLLIEAHSSRAAYGPMTPNSLQAPILLIQSQSTTNEFEWSSVDLEQGIYSVEIPLMQLPEYVQGVIYSAVIIVGSEDIFSNDRSSSEGCAFGICTIEGLSLIGPDGSGAIFPPGSIPGDAMIQRSTDYVGSTPGFWPRYRGVIDSTIIISEAMTVYTPDTLSLNADIQILMKLDSVSVYPFFNSDNPIMIGRWNPSIEGWDILSSTVDTANLLISALSNKLGGFVVLSIVPIYQHICGDVNDDGAVNVGDAVFLINYVFKGGPATDPLCIGDTNDDDAVNVGDAVYLINYVFKNGSPPVESCCW